MKLNRHVQGSRAAHGGRILCVLTLALAALASATYALAQSSDSKPCSAKPAPEAETTQSFPLNNITQQSELTDIQTDIRNILSRAKIYAIPSQNVITIRGTAEDLELAQKMISELDRPRKIYRLTYTMTDIEAGKRTRTQSFSLIVASQEKTSLKQGSRVPIITGTIDTASSTPETQVQYQDVGLHIDASVVGSADGLMLRTKVDQTSIADEKSTASPQNPIVRQSSLDAATMLALGKPLVLGSVDVPGTALKQEIAVVADLVK